MRSRTRNAVREAKYAIAAGELSESESLVQEALVALDRAVQGGVVHVNSAARRKSRLLRQLQRARDTDVIQRPTTRRPDPAKAP